MPGDPTADDDGTGPLRWVHHLRNVHDCQRAVLRVVREQQHLLVWHCQWAVDWKLRLMGLASERVPCWCWAEAAGTSGEAACEALRPRPAQHSPESLVPHGLLSGAHRHRPLPSNGGGPGGKRMRLVNVDQV